MTKCLYLLGVLTLSVSCMAQVPSLRESGVFRSKVDNNWREVIVNHSPFSLVAFHATYSCPDKSGAYFDHDYLLRYGDDRDIPPGGSIEIAVPAPDPIKCPGKIDAAIFSDGSSEGDSQKVAAIYARRSGMYEALGRAIILLESVQNQTKTPQEVLADVNNMVVSISGMVTHDAYVKQRDMGKLLVYTQLQVLLRDNRAGINAPSDRTANRQPSIQQVIDDMHVTQAQAQAIVVVNKMLEWRRDLEGHMEAPGRNSSPN